MISLYSSISKIPKFLKQLKAIALTLEFILSFSLFFIGLKISDILLSIQFCNLADINNFFSLVINSEFKDSARGRYILDPLVNRPTFSSPQ